jgi:hypothetical protein
MVQKAGSVRLAEILLTKLGQIMGNNLVVYKADIFTSSLVQTQSDKKSGEEKKIVKEKAVISDDKGMLSFANMLF